MLEITLEEPNGDKIMFDIEAQSPEDIYDQVKEYLIKNKYSDFELTEINETEFKITKTRRQALCDNLGIETEYGSRDIYIKKLQEKFFDLITNGCKLGYFNSTLRQLLELFNIEKVEPTNIYDYHYRRDTINIIIEFGYIKILNIVNVRYHLDSPDLVKKLRRDGRIPYIFDRGYLNAAATKLIKSNEHDKLSQLMDLFPKKKNFGCQNSMAFLDRAILYGDKKTIDICMKNGVLQKSIDFVLRKGSLETIKKVWKKTKFAFSIYDFKRFSNYKDPEKTKFFISILNKNDLLRAIDHIINLRDLDLLKEALKFHVEKIEICTFMKVKYLDQYDILFNYNAEKNVVYDSYDNERLPIIKNKLKNIEYVFYYDRKANDFLRKIKE